MSNATIVQIHPYQPLSLAAEFLLKNRDAMRILMMNSCNQNFYYYCEKLEVTRFSCAIFAWCFFLVTPSAAADPPNTVQERAQGTAGVKAPSQSPATVRPNVLSPPPRAPITIAPEPAKVQLPVTPNADHTSRDITNFQESQRLRLVSCKFPADAGYTVGLSVLAYLIIMLVFRWNMIAKPTTRIYSTMLEAELADLETFCSKNSSAATLSLINFQREKLQHLVKASSATEILELLFWNRGKELSGMISLHVLRHQRLVYLTDSDDIENQLKTCRARLLQLEGDTLAKDFSDRIASKQPGESEKTRKFLLVDTIRYLDDKEDSAFSIMAGWHNKTFWLIVASLLLILGLSHEIGNQRLFLLGATGGLLSRLTYSLYRSDVPTDYGASWSKIFLSPVVGALTGWGGIMLLYFTNAIGITGHIFNLDWCGPDIFVYSLAIVMGFSERLFTGILTQLEDETSKKQSNADEQKLGPKGSLAIPPIRSVPEEKYPPLAIITDSISEIDSTHNYTSKIAVIGGKPKYQFSALMPPSLKIDDDGNVSGILTDQTITSIEITVTDQNKTTVKRNIALKR